MFNIIKEKTQEDLVIESLEIMDRRSQSIMDTFENVVNDIYEEFWFGSISPIDKINALGTNALKVFISSAQAQEFIKLNKPEYIKKGIPEKYDLVFNEDGSVTINEKTN